MKNCKNGFKFAAIGAIAMTGLLSLGSAAAAAPVDPVAPRVLIVVSSEGRDQGKTRPGFEMDEFAQTWLLLRANGIEIDVASPAGGAVEADRYDPKTDYNARLLADAQAQSQLRQTLATASVRAADYRAVLVMGGKGAMFDLPKDVALQRLIAAVDAQGGTIAAVCHGPAALAEVRRADGQALVAGRRLTGFTNEEEAAFGKKWAKQFPWLLEDRLKGLGARWEEASMMLPKVVVDGRLITGQNPFSTTAMTEAVLRSLGREPLARAAFQEEATLTLARRWLDAEPAEQSRIEALLATDAKLYKIELLAMLGLYQFKQAADDANRRQGLSLMRLAAPYFPHRQLRLAIAEAQQSLGNTAAARRALQALLQEQPDYAEARLALAALPG
jgi:putative intracellular protease/amidase